MMNVVNRNFANYPQNVQKNKQNLSFGASPKLGGFVHALKEEAFLSAGTVLLMPDTKTLTGLAVGRVLSEGLNTTALTWKKLFKNPVSALENVVRYQPTNITARILMVIGRVARIASEALGRKKSV